MRRTSAHGVVRIICAVIPILLLLRPPALAQDVTEPALKAAFIYNFAKFTEWPGNALPAAGTFVMCVVGDAAVGEALERAVRDRMLAGHSMAVLHEAAPGPGRVCHVLYVTGVATGNVPQIVGPLRDLPVLTISDVQGFTEIGGIAQFFFEHGQLRFTVQNESAKRAQLLISSRLLALARRQ